MKTARSIGRLLRQVRGENLNEYALLLLLLALAVVTVISGFATALADTLK